MTMQESGTDALFDRPKRKYRAGVKRTYLGRKSKYANDDERRTAARKYNTERAARRRAGNRERVERNSEYRSAIGNHHVRIVEVPLGVLIERDIVLAAERSLTAQHFGDPLPGRSALDRRQGDRTLAPRPALYPEHPYRPPLHAQSQME